MNVALEHGDLELLGPASELGELWHEAASRRSLSPEFDARTASELVGLLLGLLDQPPHLLEVDELAEYLGDRVALLPELDALAALRPVLRDRATARLPVRLATVVLERSEDLVEALVALRVRIQMEALESAAFVDPLTGCGNRRALERDLARELSRTLRHQRPLAIVAIDLDGLKQVNDEEGHAAGDAVLRRLASAAKRSLRDADTVYRVGGDEFVLLLTETEPDTVPALLGRMRALAPPFSAGVASAPVDGTVGQDLLATADAAMLEGRRQVRSGRGAARTTVPADAAGTRPAGSRLQVRRIQTSSQDDLFTVTVVLAGNGVEITGQATGSAASSARLRLVANATVDALGVVDPALRMAYVSGAAVSRVGEIDVVLVGLAMSAMGTEEVMVGATPLRHQMPDDAAARAVLDALNRRVSMGAGRPEGRLDPAAARGGLADMELRP